MGEEFELYNNETSSELLNDPFEYAAAEVLEQLFADNKECVFYGRQLEVMHEDNFFHWVTNRAVRFLAERKIIKKETKPLKWGGNITLYWNRSFRYYKGEAKKIVDAVETYSQDKIGSSTGGYCELLVVEGFAKFQYMLMGRATNEYRGKKWERSSHDLDMIIEKDEVGYGVEIKNTLGYIDIEEFRIKRTVCDFLGLKSIFAVRMLPKSWAYELIRAGGYAMIMKYLLYPEFFGDVAAMMRNDLHLPVECPKSLSEGTIQRFDNWHQKHVNSK